MPTPRKPAAAADPPPPALPPDPPPPPPAAKLPGNVTAAAILLLIFGTLAGIGTAMSLLAALAFSARRFMPGFGDGFNGFDHFDGGGMFVMGFTPVLVTLVLGAAVTAGHLAAGAGILQRMTWGRILGMVVSGAALIVVALSLTASIIWVVVLPDFSELGDGRMWLDWIRTLMTWTVAVGIVVGALLIAAYGYVLWVLARADETFD